MANIKKQASESCAVRLKKALSLRGMKQSELADKTGIARSAICEYLKGTYEPKQDKLTLLANALNVNEVWLMGFDVPKEKENSPSERQLTEGETMLLDLFRRIPEEHQQIVLQMIRAAISNLK